MIQGCIRPSLGLIKRKQLSILVELVQTPDKAFLINLDHKNADEVHFRIIRSSHDLVDERNQKKWDDRFKHLTKIDAIDSWSVTDLNQSDYLNHSTEVEVKPLPIGMYMLLACTDKNFKDKSILQIAFYLPS